ncbi:BCCT family transporter [Salimicrobium halophilum]|uniref:BCCT, betaine/carnitine/choline family transporter n=1 Tax=Salimicrobium halophilum TaxID=86666 RepID=A0A1G8UFZ7_9BACI|nr:BCCT family transporter [Salimicrobium halophilum]SDJ52658.1 BCCT, betaine/carnitine/choline family transporter [Salimicrobium halophilum]
MGNKNLIDFKIFIPALLIIIAISIPFAMYESESLEVLNSIFNSIVESFTWGYLWYGIILVVAGLYLSFSKYGKVVLGDPKEKPRFSMFEYASILIAMGVGSTIMRTGMLQWTSVANDPPAGVEAGSPEAVLWGNAYSMFLWGFQVFAIFVLIAPAMGYILHVKKRPLMRISEACRVLFGDKFTDGLGGKFLDVLFLVSILSGAAVTLGLGAPIVTHNLAFLMGTEVNFTLTIIVTIVWVFLFSLSAYAGIEKGIKRLSTWNMYIAGFFAMFILLAGPGVFILNYFSDSVSFLISNYVNMSLNTDSVYEGGMSHVQSNTVFWFAYSATWAMLHGVFAAKISRGRTIKEMILTYFLAPTLISWIATGVLGGLGVYHYLKEDMGILNLVENEARMAAIPEILSTLPFGWLAIIIFMIVALIFLTTTLDSTTYTVAAYTSTRDMSKFEPPKTLRIIIAAIITGVALVLMRIGGLPPLSVVSGLMGLPIIVLQFILIWAAIKMMNKDEAWKYNIRK